MLKRITTLFVIATLFGMSLAACASSSDQAYPSTGVTEPLPGVTEVMPGVTGPTNPTGEAAPAYPAPEEGTGGETPAAETPAVEAPVTEPPAVETTPAEPAATEVIPPTGPIDPGRVSNLLGLAVTGPDGQQIGQLDDIILDLNMGAATYAVVSISDEASGESKLVPIPITKFTWDETNGTLVLAADSETILAAPYFEGGEYPNTQETGWDAEFQSYWTSANPGS